MLRPIHKYVLCQKKIFILFFVLLNTSLAPQTGTVGEEAQKKLYERLLNDYPVSKDAVRLDLITYFPRFEDVDSDCYFWQVLDIEINNKGLIFASDTKAHRILVFNDTGDFERQIGKKGQAPGEFIRPRGLAHTEELLVVNDTGNSRFQFFDFQGAYVNSFQVFKTYYDIAANTRGLIFAAPMRTSVSDSLVDVFNQEGNILYSFGVGKKFKNWGQINWVRLCADLDNVYIAFQYLPIVQKYSISGKLLGEYYIGRGFMKEQERMNKKRVENIRSSNHGLINIIQDIKINRGNPLIFISHPRDEIFEIDNSGCIIHSWYATKTYGTLEYAFSLDPQNAEKRFYILQVSPDNCIRVYKEFDAARKSQSIQGEEKNMEIADGKR